MFNYNVKPYYSISVFNDICERMEKCFPEIKEKEYLEDPLDLDMLRIYELNGKKIKVYNYFLVDAVYVVSEINLNKLFLPMGIEPYFTDD